MRVGEEEETLIGGLLYAVFLEGEDKLNMLSKMMNRQTAPNRHNVKQPRFCINTIHSFYSTVAETEH